MIGLNLFGEHGSAAIRANRVQHCANLSRNWSSEHIAPIFRAPYHMVSCLIDTIAVCNDVNHVKNYTPHGRLRRSAIPPATEVAGSLARFL